MPPFQYRLGTPCRRGHSTPEGNIRRRDNGACVECQRQRASGHLDPITVTTPRQIALAEGRKVYFTGQPCPKGHAEEGRWTTSGQCVTCNRENKHVPENERQRARPSKPRPRGRKGVTAGESSKAKPQPAGESSAEA